jgi:molybdopterin molybdotransferase
MQGSASQPLVLSFEDARRIVEEHASQLAPGPTEISDLLQASGRILAESIFADRDIPPFPRSTRDGFAVRSTDLTAIPTQLNVRGEIKAGPIARDIPSLILPGEAYAIMTGAPVPRGADAVAMIEHTTLQGGVVEISRRVARGENVVAQGAEAQNASLLLAPGTRMNEAAVALAASVGKSHVNIFRQPRVAVLTTGDEIVAIDAEVGPSQIRNSNSYSLAVQIQQAGGAAVLLPIAPDEREQLRQLIEEGLQADLLIITGGVSMGRYDLVEQVMAKLHAEFLFLGAKIQPGRPVVFGRIPCGADAPCGASAPAREALNQIASKYFFGLPGNPVSTMVTFELFARPVIEALGGATPRPLVFLHARLKSEIRVKPGLKRFLPAYLSGQFENVEVEIVPWQGSGDIAARARSNCFLVVPADQESIAAGEWVAVMPR